MAKDQENIAKMLLGTPQGMKLLMSMDKIKDIVNSKEGKKLLEVLGGEGGDAIKAAARDAVEGDGDAAKRLMNSLLSSKQGAEVVRGFAELVKNQGK